MARRKSHVLSTIAIVLVIVLAVGALGFATQGFSEWNPAKWFQRPQTETPADITDEKGNELGGDQIYAMPQKLNFSAVSADSVSASNGITIRATVLPENADNKSVDWSVAWAEDSALKNENVSDYLTVVPASDGSTTAVITCLKAFRDNMIVITVTTRDGGFTADCYVSYIGKLASLSFEGYTDSVDSYGNRTMALGSSRSYSFNILTDNDFHDVGADMNFTVSVRAVGSIRVQDYRDGMDYKAWQGSEKTVAVADFADRFLSCAIVGNTLQITAKTDIQAYYRTSTSGGYYTTYLDKFKSFVGAEPFFEITVKDSISGVSAVGNFRVKSAVTSVSFGSNTITF